MNKQLFTVSGSIHPVLLKLHDVEPNEPVADGERTVNGIHGLPLQGVMRLLNGLNEGREIHGGCSSKGKVRTVERQGVMESLIYTANRFVQRLCAVTLPAMGKR